VVRLNFLAPSIVNLILDGHQPVRLSPRSIVGTSGMPIIWAEQVELLSAI
jgi:hypothetical protein